MRRVAVTGLGVVSSVGNNLSEFWSSLKDGRSGIDWIEGFDTSQFQVKIAGQVKNFDPLRYMDRKEVRRNARFVQLAIASAQEAFEDSHLDGSNFDRERAGVIYGVGLEGWML